MSATERPRSPRISGFATASVARSMQLLAPLTTSMASAVRWMDRNLGVALTTSDIATVSPLLGLLQGA